MAALDTLLPKAISLVCANYGYTGMWSDALSPFMLAAGISTPKRVAAFIGQVSVESGGFTAVSENLGYSADRLCKVWPTHFPADGALAAECARNPERIANVAYANRGGNGDEASGDGWRYRGAGLIQLTGKTNQSRFAAAAKLPLDTIGDYLRTPKGAAHSACWFWTDAGLNSAADGWFLTAMSRKINGGDNGLQERLDACNLIRKAIGA